MISTRQECRQDLQRRIRQLECAHLTSLERVSTGCEALDKLLPGKGFHRGALVEWLAAPGSGAAGLALLAAREACREGDTLVVIDEARRFYPLAAAGLGIDLARLVIVCPASKKDSLWAVHQSLGCQGVGAVVAWPEKLDDRAFRRIQLAAERGRSLGFLLRPTAARGQPTWSEIQLLVTALPSCSTFSTLQSTHTARRLRIELLRSRSGHTGTSVELEFDDEHGVLKKIDTAHALPLAPPLAARSAGRHSSGA